MLHNLICILYECRWADTMFCNVLWRCFVYMFKLISYFNVSILINHRDSMNISGALAKLRKIVIDIWTLLNLTWLQNTLFTVKVKIYDKLCTHTSLNFVVLEATDDLQSMILSTCYNFNLIYSEKILGIAKNINYKMISVLK